MEQFFGHEDKVMSQTRTVPNKPEQSRGNPRRAYTALSKPEQSRTIPEQTRGNPEQYFLDY